MGDTIDNPESSTPEAESQVSGRSLACELRGLAHEAEGTACAICVEALRQAASALEARDERIQELESQAHLAEEGEFAADLKFRNQQKLNESLRERIAELEAARESDANFRDARFAEREASYQQQQADAVRARAIPPGWYGMLIHPDERCHLWIHPDGSWQVGASADRYGTATEAIAAARAAVEEVAP